MLRGGGHRLGLVAPHNALKDGPELLVGGDGIQLAQQGRVPVANARLFLSVPEAPQTGGFQQLLRDRE